MRLHWSRLLAARVAGLWGTSEYGRREGGCQARQREEGDDCREAGRGREEGGREGGRQGRGMEEGGREIVGRQGRGGEEGGREIVGRQGRGMEEGGREGGCREARQRGGGGREGDRSKGKADGWRREERGGWYTLHGDGSTAILLPCPCI